MLDIPKLYTASALAAVLDYSRSYIQAAKRAGFAFSHGRRTTVEPFLSWLAANPDFRTTQVYGPGANKKRRH